MYFLPFSSYVSPLHSSCPASIPPNITKSAPAPNALAISPGTVQGGNVHGALEGVFLEAQNPDFPTADLSVLSIGKFLEEERPSYVFQKAYEEEIEDMYVDPNSQDSTELGEVPQAVKKGSIQPYDVRRYLTGIY